MDSIKSLMDEHQYELVIRITENSKNPEDLFYRISALIATFKVDDALKCIEKNREILMCDMSILVKFHIELLCIMGKFDQAQKEMEYYSSLPYVSQEVEELLKELPKQIERERLNSLKGNTTYIPDEELIDLLNDKNSEAVLDALNMVRNRDIFPFLACIKNILVNCPKQAVRSFALFVLVHKELDREVKFNHMGKIITVNPKQLITPFEEKSFELMNKKITKEIKDVTICENAKNIYSSYVIYTYPDVYNGNLDELLLALKIVAGQYINAFDEEEMKQECLKLNLNYDSLSSLVNKITDILEDF